MKHPQNFLPFLFLFAMFMLMSCKDECCTYVDVDGEDVSVCRNELVNRSDWNTTRAYAISQGGECEE